MIVIFCDDFQDAQDAYQIFTDFLAQYEPGIIIQEDPYSLRVSTDEDLTYIFVDYRMAGVFQGVTEDMMDVEEFFEDLFSYYGVETIEDFHYGWIPW